MTSVLAREGEYTWEVWLQDAGGGNLHNLNFLKDFQLTRNADSPGYFSITLPVSEMRALGYLSFPAREIFPDKIVSFWRGWPGHTNLEVFSGHVSKVALGLSTLTLSGGHVLGLLARRIIAYPAGSSYATKTGKIDDLMKAIVRENLGSSATDTDRLISSLTIESDEGAGISVTRAFSRDNVLSALQELAALSHQTATPVPIYFDLERYGTGGFIFRTFPQQRGADKSEILPAFSVKMGNLENPEYLYETSKAASVIYVGGAGEEASRLVVEVEDAELSGLSSIGRREKFINDTRITTSTEATTRGQQALDENKPLEILKGTLINTPNSRFGEHWNFGDKVKIEHQGQVETVRINNLSVSVGANGERITSSFEKVVA